MPLRSPKMYFCIFGFQRLVWWPKWTPASSSSFIVSVAIRLSPPPSPPGAKFPPPCSPAEKVEETTDRKSTRLNSSHEWISYAVFCLKKKRHQHLPGIMLPESLSVVHPSQRRALVQGDVAGPVARDVILWLSLAREVRGASTINDLLW